MKQRTLIAAIVVLLTMSSMAQEQIPLWDIKELPNYQKSKEKEIIPERDILWIEKIQTPSIQPFIPTQKNANGMAVLICPGGGYRGLAYDWEGTDYAKWLNSRGIAAFVLRYRLPEAASIVTPYKAPLQDAQRAMRWIRSNAAKYHVDANKVGVIGSSAGGHLASSIGTHYEMPIYDRKDSIDALSARPDFMMLIYPVISMQEGLTHKGSKKNLLGKNPSPELVEEFSNELQVTNDTPPTFMVHSADDKAVPVENSIRMYQALVKHKVSATMHLFPTGGHGYSMGLSREGAPHWTKLAEDWFATLE
ncbi:alpha/beta hydrolase [Saccharicrinis aurantiacus]|uniref:alpha/beta hydrolase n=1 Tax=Saccharicrinis aurantiacus TaxID=1849719 RepID=UPI002492948D|nr:alpha/beta hydrolase [Saccharicrinis aurantiacus]